MMDAPEADELSPAAKRRRLDAGEERSLIGTEQKDKPASEAGDLERDKEQADDKSGSEDAPQDEAMSIPEADTSLSRVEDDEDEWNAVYDDLEWDGVLEMEEAGTAARAIFSPNQARSQAAPHQPSSSPLKAGVVVNNAVEARETVNASQQPIPSSQHSPSGQDEEEEARIRAHEEALLAKYKNLDYLTKFNDLQSAFNSPAQGGNSAAFSSAGFTSVRGKSLKPSDEALAKASRFAQLSPEAASDKGEGSSTSDALALSAETPLVQRSRSALPFPNHVQSTSREASAPPTVSRFSRPSEVQPLRPLRYGPKKGHSLLPNRVPTAVHQGITTLEAVPFPVINNIPSGFTSGSGKRVVMPSKEQAEKHVRTLEGNEQEEATNVETAGQLSSSPSEGYPGLSFAGGGTFKMPSKALLDKEKDKMERTVSQSVNHVDMQPSSDAQSTKFAGLQSASGKAISIPSEEAVNKVVDSLDSGRKGVPTASFGGFATGSGKPVVPPTEEQIRVATTKLDNPEINAVPIHSPSHALGGRQSFTGLTSGGGKAIAGPSAEAVAASNSRLSMDQDAMAVDKAATTPARPALASKAANIMRAHTPGMTPGGSSAKPFLPPTSALSKSSKVPVALPSTPGRPGGSQLSSTQQPRRLNLEMTPRNTPKSALNRSTFKTPFKNGQRPDAQMLKKLKEDSNSKMVNPGRNVDVVASQVASTPKQSQAARNNAEHRLVKNSVFDMYTKMPRKSMKEYGFNPYVDTDELIDRHIPTEVIFMTYEKAEAFKFRGEFGVEAAYDDLVYYSDCSSASLGWVKNHWTLIVWKTAAMVRAKPDEAKNWWNFQRIVDQLKYRYEREVICGQRSCIKRIQEHDSSPWLPMILVVTEIIYEQREIPPEPGSDEERQGICGTELVAVAIVLSDGWYKIQTSSLDDSLFRAVTFRSIYPGLKIRVQGAKLEGGSEGAEPLEAFANSTLAISGNSTSRAAWHEKLGFQKRPYICAFSSLLPDGGVVPFIDVIITRVYPLGYKGPYVEGETPDVWDEEEERARQKKWESDRELAIIDVQNEQRKAHDRLLQLQYAVGNSLRARGKHESVVKDEDPAFADFSEVYDKLEDAPDKTSVILRRVSKEVLADLADFIKRKLEAFISEGGQGLDKEIEARCPPRVAKAFRIVRVKDSRVRASESRRDCQLNITDVLKLGPDYLVEGKRYLISNLNPGRPTSWSAPNSINGEIFLSTRFDSKWQVLPL